MSDKCQRCGAVEDDLRTLEMSCLYAMEELPIPFLQHEGGYLLQVCKACRADWLLAIEAWFEWRPRPSVGSGIFMRVYGDNREVTREEFDALRAKFSEASPAAAAATPVHARAVSAQQLELAVRCARVFEGAFKTFLAEAKTPLDQRKVVVTMLGSMVGQACSLAAAIEHGGNYEQAATAAGGDLMRALVKHFPNTLPRFDGCTILDDLNPN